MNTIEVEIDSKATWTISCPANDVYLTNGEKMKVVDMAGATDSDDYCTYQDIIVSYKDKLWRFNWVTHIFNDYAEITDFYDEKHTMTMVEVEKKEIITYDYIAV